MKYADKEEVRTCLEGTGSISTQLLNGYEFDNGIKLHKN